MVHDSASPVLSCVVSSHADYEALEDESPHHIRSDETHTLMPPPYIVQSRFMSGPPHRAAARRRSDNTADDDASQQGPSAHGPRSDYAPEHRWPQPGEPQ